MISDQKTCIRCGVSKPLEEFHANKRIKRDGRAAACRTCVSERRKENKELNERINARFLDPNAPEPDPSAILYGS